MTEIEVDSKTVSESALDDREANATGGIPPESAKKGDAQWEDGREDADPDDGSMVRERRGARRRCVKSERMGATAESSTEMGVCDTLE